MISNKKGCKKWKIIVLGTQKPDPEIRERLSRVRDYRYERQSEWDGFNWSTYGIRGDMYMTVAELPLIYSMPVWLMRLFISGCIVCSVTVSNEFLIRFRYDNVGISLNNPRSNVVNRLFSKFNRPKLFSPSNARSSIVWNGNEWHLFDNLSDLFLRLPQASSVSSLLSVSLIPLPSQFMYDFHIILLLCKLI